MAMREIPEIRSAFDQQRGYGNKVLAFHMPRRFLYPEMWMNPSSAGAICFLGLELIANWWP